MFSKWSCFVACAFFTVCSSAFVDTLGKCSYKDEKCLILYIQDNLKDISVNGIPDLSVSPIDPTKLKDISIPIVGLLNIQLDDGEMTGIKECMVGSFRMDIEKGVTNMDITCDLFIKAKFRVTDISPLIQNVLGQNLIKADGNVNLKLEKVQMKMKFFYHMIKKEDGDIYFKDHLDEFTYDIEIGDLKISANEVFFGDQNISEFVETFVNQNWKHIIPSFGKDIFVVGMDIFKHIFHRLFDIVPANRYVTDDLSAFIKN